MLFSFAIKLVGVAKRTSFPTCMKIIFITFKLAGTNPAERNAIPMMGIKIGMDLKINPLNVSSSG